MQRHDGFPVPAEPATSWMLRLRWCFAGESTPYSRAVLAALQTTYAVVPALWPFEVASGLAVAERRERISQHQVAEFLRNAVETSDPCRTAGDLANRDRLPLAALDRDLQEAGSVSHKKNYPIRNTFITSPPRWLITFTAIRPGCGLSNGRDVSLFQRRPGFLIEPRFSVVLSDL